MKLATGTVIQGKVVIDGGALPEGMVVSILAREEDDDSFDVPAELEAELQESLAQAARGQAIPVAEVLRRLRAV